ncbi:bifunctional 2-polyprenyl-6-hydroxyphenol methylase/3-demethylubiquinol 3-O-methyltransferase UbiG [Halorubrum sp. T3]|uniref:class I SAM-dependent methyltransferase n=1 Tax=Halorubrum sp. T3 TaxID=1194088 RepID=UPI0009E27E13|nr:class I SAM-dependent methyltransferase [Halorubrum sp. T3]
MEHQRDIHDESWRSRKPERDVVLKKPRVKYTLSLLEDLLNQNDVIFDLGCGDGTFGKALKKGHTITVDGCDISKIAVDRAREHYRTVHQLNIDDEDIPTESGSYDTVICTDVLEHTLSPTHALEEIQRILKDDGTAIITVPNFGFARYRVSSLFGNIPSIIRDDRHYNTFTVSSLREMFDECGLEARMISGISGVKRLANMFPSVFAKTIVVIATNTSHEG